MNLSRDGTVSGNSAADSPTRLLERTSPAIGSHRGFSGCRVRQRETVLRGSRLSPVLTTSSRVLSDSQQNTRLARNTRTPHVSSMTPSPSECGPKREVRGPAVDLPHVSSMTRARSDWGTKRESPCGSGPNRAGRYGMRLGPRRSDEQSGIPADGRPRMTPVEGRFHRAP